LRRYSLFSLDMHFSEQRPKKKAWCWQGESWKWMKMESYYNSPFCRWCFSTFSFKQPHVLIVLRVFLCFRFQHASSAASPEEPEEVHWREHDAQRTERGTWTRHRGNSHRVLDSVDEEPEAAMADGRRPMSRAFVVRGMRLITWTCCTMTFREGRCVLWATVSFHSLKCVWML